MNVFMAIVGQVEKRGGLDTFGSDEQQESVYGLFVYLLCMSARGFCNERNKVL